MKSLLIIVLLAIFTSCEKNNQTDNKLIGKWLDKNTCDSCLIFEFKLDNELLIHELSEDSPDTLYYKLLKDDYIEIDYIEKEEYKINYYSNDSIEIFGFSVSIIPENNSTILKKINE